MRTLSPTSHPHLWLLLAALSFAACDGHLMGEVSRLESPDNGTDPSNPFDDGDDEEPGNPTPDGGTGDGGTTPDGGTGETDAGTGEPDGGTEEPALANFSFFVTSIESIRRLANSQDGFGGDLRFGEATGIAGADKICTTIAESSMPGASRKVWRAFLSASTGGPNNGPLHAIDRVGAGPWYDRNGRLIAPNLAGLRTERPSGTGTTTAIANDLPNERGEPNKQGTDNHDTLTGSNRNGQYVGTLGGTCNDWTSSVGSTGKPQIGHAWPRSASSGRQWIADHTAPGCAAGVNLIQNGGGDGTPTVGGGGGYGAFYCFALSP